jgi:hypothetical protein
LGITVGTATFMTLQMEHFFVAIYVDIKNQDILHSPVVCQPFYCSQALEHSLQNENWCKKAVLSSKQTK